MSNFFTIVIFGAFFGLFPVILFYAGIFTNYLSFYEIKEYFNPFFANNFNFYFYFVFALFSGIAFLIESNILRFIYLVFSIMMSLTFIPQIGRDVGSRIFFNPNAKIMIDGKLEKINLIYKNKNTIYYNTPTNKTIVSKSIG